jgi:hypothetical protein
MKNIGVFFLLLVSTLALCQDPQPGPVCEDYNTGFRYYYNGAGQPWWQASGTAGHAGYGTHTGATVLGGECIYLSQSTQFCEIVASAQGYGYLAYDSGGVANPLLMHAVSSATSDGAGTSNGPSISTVVTGAIGATACLKAFGCSVGITFEAKPLGIGTTVNFTNPNLGFDEKFPFTNWCGQMIDPTWRPCVAGCSGGGGGGGYIMGPPALWINIKNGKSVVIDPSSTAEQH